MVTAPPQPTLAHIASAARSSGPDKATCPSPSRPARVECPESAFPPLPIRKLPSYPHRQVRHAPQTFDLQRFSTQLPAPIPQQRRPLCPAPFAIHHLVPRTPQPQSAAAFAIFQLHRHFILPIHADEIHKCPFAYEIEKSATSYELPTVSSDCEALSK